jgi:hypothetical protein
MASMGRAAGPRPAAYKENPPAGRRARPAGKFARGLDRGWTSPVFPDDFTMPRTFTAPPAIILRSSVYLMSPKGAQYHSPGQGPIRINLRGDCIPTLGGLWTPFRLATIRPSDFSHKVVAISFDAGNWCAKARNMSWFPLAISLMNRAARCGESVRSACNMVSMSSGMNPVSSLAWPRSPTDRND